MTIKEDGSCHYMRRVPSKFAHIDSRRFVKKSLKTRNPQEALKRALNYNDIVEADWLEKAGNTIDDPFTAFTIATKRANHHGFSYKTSEEISESAIERIVDRLFVVAKAIDSPQTVSAVLGGKSVPKIMLTDCVDKYWPLCTELLLNKTEHQIKKWKNPRSKAFEEFIQVVGSNLSVQDIKRKHALDFEAYLRSEITAERIVGDTANKKIRNVKDILLRVTKKYEIDIGVKTLFEDIKFKDVRKSRPPFEAKYVQDVFLSGNKLSKMNFEARMLVYAMCDSGARESEILRLRPEDIFLDDDIPYIWIRPYKGHSLKTKSSERKIPLVGSALFAMQQMKYGFDQSKNPDSTTTAINKFLRENKLLPSHEYSLYSLRHTFKDRLRDATSDAELRDELMGHSSKRPHYGRGYRLEDKYNLLQKIAFSWPIEHYSMY